jgi:general secretion pathway protein D
VHHNKEVTLKLTIEVSNLNGFVEVQAGQRQPIIGTRNISSSIRLKDGETNFLAGLFRTDKSNTTNSVPFLGDIPILGRLFSKKSTTDTSTDLVLTLTPHILRIPDVTAEDLEPVYVGTDSNISFQGSPRIESPGQGGPFDFGRREPSVPRGSPPPPAPVVTPVPQILVPGGMPSDPFRPNPRDAIPPQGERPPTTPGVSPQSSAPVRESSGAVAFDFEPASLSLAPGDVRTVLVRATGAGIAPSGTVEIAFDPAILSVLAVRPIPAVNGVAEGRVEPGRVVLDLPAGAPLSGGSPVAEITLRAIAPGRSKLAFEKATTSGEAILSEAAVEVRTQ